MNGNWEDNIMMVAKFYKALGYKLKDIKSTNNGLEPVVGAIAGMLERISTPTIEDFYEYKTLEYLAEQLKKDSSTITGSMLERMLGDKKAPEIENCSKDLEKNIERVYKGVALSAMSKLSKQEKFNTYFQTFWAENHETDEVVKAITEILSGTEFNPSYFFEMYRKKPEYRCAIEKAFKDEILAYEKKKAANIRKSLTSRIQTIIIFFKSCGYLDRIVDTNNKAMENAGLDFLKVTTEEDKQKFNVMNLASDRYIGLFDMNELFVLCAYYTNRLEKVVDNFFDGVFLHSKLDMFYETVEYGEIPRKIDLDDIKTIMKQKSFLDSLSRSDFLALKNRVENGGDFEVEELSNVPEEFIEKYSEVYTEYFDRYVPTSENDFQRDYQLNFFDKMSSYLMYKLKDFSIESFLYTLSDNQSKVNFGLVNEERKKVNEYGEKQVLIGVDLKEFTTIMLHFPERDFKEFVNQFFSDKKFPNYYGNEDFELRTQPIKTHIAYKYTKAQKQQIKKLYETMDKKNSIYPYVRHLYWNIHPSQNPLNSKKKKDIEI